MDGEFEDAKKEYLARIESEYAPPAVEHSWGLIIKKTYTPTKEYASKLKSKPDVGEFVEVRNTSGWLFFIVLLFVLFTAQGIMNNGNNWIKFFVFAGAFLVIVLLSIGLSKIPGRKKMFWMNKDIIWIYKADTEINWEFVLRTDIKTVSDYDSTNHFFIIHFYDKEYQYFRSLEMDTGKINISPEKLSFYIEHFKRINQHIHV